MKADADVLSRIVAAKAGESVTYWTGNLAADRDASNTDEAKRKLAKAAGDEAMHASERGFCHLVQRRLSHGLKSEFDYIAVRR